MKPSLIVLATLVLAISPPAVAQAGTDVAAHANSRVEAITSVDEYLDGIAEAVALAAQGGYGALARRDQDRLAIAQAQITMLLRGRSSALELSLAQRIELYNAQETVTSILRSDQKDRVVCRRTAATGTRIPTIECLTVAERERRARGARLAADHLPRPTCVPDQGHGC